MNILHEQKHKRLFVNKVDIAISTLFWTFRGANKFPLQYAYCEANN